jgi:kynurenine formamidase
MKTFLMILVSCVGLLTTCSGQPSLSGNWISAAIEKNANGSFSIRKFLIKKESWEIAYSVYADSSDHQPVFLFRAVGNYSIEERSKSVVNAYNAVFRFSKKYITLNTKDTSLIRKFGLGSCGLVYNTEKDITETGCAYLASKAACAQEYDLVSVQNEQLLLGARPASGGMCDVQKRPGMLGLPLKKYGVPMAEHHTSQLPFTHIVDLTHTLNSAFPFIPTEVTYAFEMRPIATIEKMGVAANEWKIHEHIGTQFDAPNHFIKGGLSADQVNVHTLFVPVCIIDISEKASRDRDAVLSIADIQSWEERQDRIPVNSAVFIYTGWEEKIHTPEFIGLDSAHVKHFPGISWEAAEFLVTQRNIAGVGVDVISFDPGYDNTYQAHKMVLGKGKWALECLANLKAIPVKGAYVFVGAPKVEGATGGIARVIAVW